MNRNFESSERKKNKKKKGQKKKKKTRKTFGHVYTAEMKFRRVTTS